MRLRFVFGEVWNGLRRNSAMVVSVILVTFVSLTFVGSAVLIQMQVQQLKQDWYGKIEVSVFLCPPKSNEVACAAGVATPAQETAIRDVLEQGSVAPLVEEIHYETPAEALEKFLNANPSGDWSSLTAEQMPASFRVKLTDPEQFDVVADAVRGLPGVEEVVDQRVIFSGLFSLLTAGTVLSAIMAAVMLLAATLLITTTIRLSALSRRRETNIMRMVGSSRTLIQLPFMLEGIVAASFGAVLAVAGLWAAVRFFVEDWLRSAVSFVDYVGVDDVWRVAPWLLVAAVVLAGVASAATLGKYTRA